MTTESTSSSPSILIRSYQPSDLSACLELFTAVHSEYGNPMGFVRYIQQTEMTDIEQNYLKIPNGHWWVAVSTDDNRVVGQVAVLPLQLAEPAYYYELPEEQRDHICELRRMGVASDVQRQGVGKKLLSTLIDFAREKGYHQVHLTTLNNMKKACAFYEKYGFIKGRIEKFSLEENPLKTVEDLKNYIFDRPKSVIFEAGAIIPDEEQRLMNMPLSQSKFLYIQHYSLML